MLVLDFCCCCFPLRTGCLVIGYLNLIANIILAIYAILSLSAGISMAYSGLYSHQASTIVISVSTVLLIFILIYVAFTIALLYGLHKEKPRHVKAYLVYGLVFLIIYTVLFIVNLILGAHEPIGIVGRIVEIALSAYFLLVIRSQYVRMLGTNYNSS
ncbi:unnamed protein product, partial [Brenthis ino]